MISFIMPAKNAAPFIREAILALKAEKDVEWELIVVDDNSTDETHSIVAEEGVSDPRIRVFINTGSGKVQGLNYGFSLSKGEIIKCIDADDVLLPAFFKHSSQMTSYDAHCHDFFIADEKLRRIGSYYLNTSILQAHYLEVVRLMISVPRCTWSMKRSIAEKVFPMPTELPFEDVWFSFIVKQHATSILHIKERLYLYRQHYGQTFGGILNFEKEKINFRAKRALRLIEVLRNNKSRLGIDDGSIFDYSQKYNSLISEQFRLKDIVRSSIKISHKAKLLLICYMPSLASLITQLKWKWDSLKA